MPSRRRRPTFGTPKLFHPSSTTMPNGAKDNDGSLHGHHDVDSRSRTTVTTLYGGFSLLIKENSLTKPSRHCPTFGTPKIFPPSSSLLPERHRHRETAATALYHQLPPSFADTIRRDDHHDEDIPSGMFSNSRSSTHRLTARLVHCSNWKYHCSDVVISDMDCTPFMFYERLPTNGCPSTQPLQS